MKCRKCNKKWDDPNISICPNCKEDIYSINNEDKMEDIIKRIIDIRGYDYFTDKKSEKEKFLSIFRDLGPHLKTEQGWLRTALEYDIPSMLFHGHTLNWERSLQRAISTIEPFINQAGLKTVILSFGHALHCPEETLSRCLNSQNTIQKNTVQSKKVDTVTSGTEKWRNFKKEDWKNSDIMALVRRVLGPLLESGIANEDEVDHLQKADYSQWCFGIKLPLLKKAELGNTDKRECYFRETINIRGVRYFLCSQFFEQRNNNNRPKLEKWIEDHISGSKSRKKSDSYEKVVTPKMLPYQNISQNNLRQCKGINCQKAINRIPLWAKKPNQNNSMIVQSYFKALEIYGTATKSSMKNLATGVKEFDANFNSMLSESGNSNGHVFNYDRWTDVVTPSCRQVEDLLKVLKKDFLGIH